MSSSRYYNSYNYYNSGPYRSKSSSSSYNNYYSKPSNRPTYSYQPTAQSSTKSPKSKARTSRISDSGRIPGPYSPTLGRKKPVGTWKAKKKEEEERKTRHGNFKAENIEEELAKYQKGTFYFQEELLDDKGTSNKAKKGKTKPSINGHNSVDRYSKFGLLKTAEPAPQVVEKVDQLPGIKDKSASNDKSNQDDDTKESSSKSKKESSSDKRKDSKKEVVEDTKRRSSRKSSSSSRTKKKRSARIQQVVTVSPNRGPQGAFAAPPPDYYYPGYNYGAPPPAGYTPYEYGGVPPPIDPYAPIPPTGYAAYNPYGTGLPPPSTTADPYYTPYPAVKPGFYADGLWYPYAGATGTAYPPQGIGLTQDPYSTPKQSKRSKKNRDSANVDLTTPLNDDKSNGVKKAKMSPGRRVNKIQKQLEYYFSVENLEQDEFLRETMDKEGWVGIDTLLAFNRMKVLGATKELVAEAAFHSQIIEIDAKKQTKIRMSKYWKQYVAKRKERKSSDKKKSKRKSQSRALREKEKALDAAELNTSTIDAIVAGIEQKMERRKKRRELREKAKKKKKENENENDTEKKDDDDKDKKKGNKNDKDGSDKDNNNNKENNKPKVDKDDKAKDQNEDENVEELIKKDKEQNEDDKGDPEHNDMVEID
eukprot:CAMPEP_0201567464 /NCGR_PEP_ID=MMETSP0190_2-20130828/7965_1 /ASSEMBLY_ACC=CAM_ASM_000263 /TAXON_ID=37353 /ORGANISM="Rosalina sp." /LENGTH=645 /DNA_ID=CAMNT_0047987495 /DNA_START=119 /DNA_END=2056 /DNA_ORIENTATION=+